KRQTKDVTSTDLVNKVQTCEFQIIGRYENYAINIPNGKTIYRVNESLDKMTQQYIASVEVTNNDQLIATVKCATNKRVISEIQGIKLRPEI
ncbi:MAG: hypothetical protein I4N51_20245, partial [Acinetobacter sp.]|nr:hypothetical protein [Acinetobacter sp.]